MKRLNIKFQTLYISIKEDLTHDKERNIIKLAIELESRLQLSLTEFYKCFNIIYFRDVKDDYTSKQLMQRFFEFFKIYYEENIKENSSTFEIELIISNLLKKYVFNNEIRFKIRSKKIVFYVYNYEDLRFIKILNNKNIAIDYIESYIMNKNKYFNEDKLKKVIEESLKNYILKIKN